MQNDSNAAIDLSFQEMNYGRRFPQAFVWVQGTADGGRSQLLLTGGRCVRGASAVRPRCVPSDGDGGDRMEDGRR